MLSTMNFSTSQLPCSCCLQGDEEGKAGASRLGRVVERPGPGASHEEMTDYHRYLMCYLAIFFIFFFHFCFSLLDHEYSDDEDSELGSQSDCSEDTDDSGPLPLTPSSDVALDPVVDFAEKVLRWQTVQTLSWPEHEAEQHGVKIKNCTAG